MLNLGGFDVFSIHSSSGGRTAQQRVDDITSRLTPLLGIPDMPATAVRIYAPKNGDPSIYVFGRRIVTVDKQTAVASGYKTPMELATAWAKKLIVILPQVNYRAPGQAAPVIPTDPKPIVADDLGEIGGSTGEVKIGRMTVVRLRGVQPQGMTAAERADMLRSRIYRALSAPPAAVVGSASAEAKDDGAVVAADAAAPTPAKPDLPPTDDAMRTSSSPPVSPAPLQTGPDITVVAAPYSPAPAAQIHQDSTIKRAHRKAAKTAWASTANDPSQQPQTLVINGVPILTIDSPQARDAKQPTPLALANSWAKNIRAALAANVAPPPTANPAAPTEPSTPATGAAAPAESPAASSPPAQTPPAESPSAPPAQPPASAQPPAPSTPPTTTPNPPDTSAPPRPSAPATPPADSGNSARSPASAQTNQSQP